MTRYKTATLLAGLAVALPSPAGASSHSWAAASNVGRDPPVGAALSVPAAHGDWRGDLEAAESLLAASGKTFVLKERVHERRPDRSDNRSGGVSAA